MKYLLYKLSPKSIDISPVLLAFLLCTYKLSSWFSGWQMEGLCVRGATASRGQLSLLRFHSAPLWGLVPEQILWLQTWRMSLPLLKKETPLCCHSDKAVLQVPPSPLLPLASSHLTSQNSGRACSHSTSLLPVVSFILAQELESHFRAAISAADSRSWIRTGQQVVDR